MKQTLDHAIRAPHGHMIRSLFSAMASELLIEHKRGDTFRQDAVVKIAGTPVDISDWTITSQLRAIDDTLLEDFMVTVTNAALGRYRIEATAIQTALWPIGKAKMDLQYEYPSEGDFTISSRTFDVKVLQDITRESE